MKKSNSSMPVVGMSALLVACAATPTVSSVEQAAAAGGEIVDPLELIGDSGVTFVGANRSWFNYLGLDGRKVVKVMETGVIKELTWRVNDGGQFCQQMFSTEKEACDSVVLIRNNDGGYNSFNKESSKPGLPFTIVTGNSENF